MNLNVQNISIQPIKNIIKNIKYLLIKEYVY